MTKSRLQLTRDQILSHRRRVGALDQRLTSGEPSLRQAGWAGLQDSMPRAALLSIHARVKGTRPSILEDESLVQLWGPRFNAYVVAAEDLAVFSLGRMPEDVERRRTAHDIAARLAELLGGSSMPYGQAGKALGMDPNRLRYGAPTGTILIDWDGARQPMIRSVPAPGVDPHDARLELTRRYLHVFGPGTADGFARWAGIKPHSARAAFDALASSLIPVSTPVGDGWILAGDEPGLLEGAGPPARARLLPSGDAYYLLQGDDRGLLVPEDGRRRMLWTPRVWPGAILVEGELVGVWRRAKNKVTMETWKRLDRESRDFVAFEATSLPLPNLDAEIIVDWA